MIDYESIISTVIGVIRDSTGHKVIMENGTGKQPGILFRTYTITSPYIPQHRGIIEGDAITEDVDIFFSFTWISNDAIEVISLTQQTATSFRTMKAKQVLYDNGIAFIRAEGTGNRDTFLSIENERRHGFDARFRIRVTHNGSESEYFDSVTINNENIGG
ncbi:phage neck terminator protein [Bacillus altitudinis]|uniref:phage neck terminator protein n=1 Tax=Bacillus altitudinis TaxID=293387 RepID=UPI003CF19918